MVSQKALLLSQVMGWSEKPTHTAPVRRFHLTLETIFRLTHVAKIELT